MPGNLKADKTVQLTTNRYNFFHLKEVKYRMKRKRVILFKLYLLHLFNFNI